MLKERSKRRNTKSLSQKDEIEKAFKLTVVSNLLLGCKNNPFSSNVIHTKNKLHEDYFQLM